MTVGFSSVIIGLALVYVDCAKEDIGFVVSWSVSYFSIFFLKLVVRFSKNFFFLTTLPPISNVLKKKEGTRKRK